MMRDCPRVRRYYGPSHSNLMGQYKYICIPILAYRHLCYSSCFLDPRPRMRSQNEGLFSIWPSRSNIWSSLSLVISSCLIIRSRSRRISIGIIDEGGSAVSSSIGWWSIGISSNSGPISSIGTPSADAVLIFCNISRSCSVYWRRRPWADGLRYLPNSRAYLRSVELGYEPYHLNTSLLINNISQ